MNGEIAPKFVEKPWGCKKLLGGVASPSAERIGEIWFEPPNELDQLLVKYLFTSEKLSVQVHPTAAQTRGLGGGRNGKDECWLIVAAEAGASLALGFNQVIDREKLRTAALDGTIEQMLAWRRVQPGDFFYVPANTVHAIGGGLTLIEVQQNSDLTYRLYDYGRSRQLHLNDALAVALAEPYPDHLHRHLPTGGEICLVEGPHFRLDRVDGAPSMSVVEKYGGQPLLAMPLSGEIVISEDRIGRGKCGVASDLGQIRFSPEGLCLLAQPLQA